VENKYYGETPKYIEAIFSLARARSPCVIFIDEIDGLLSARSEIDIQAINTMKTKFMECWDGIATPDRSGRHHNAKRTASTKPAGAGKPGAGKAADDTEDENDGWVLVIGATNKP
jgi:SpoVK/Ycf46/Vps4 family AAA+-type ATPase